MPQCAYCLQPAGASNHFFTLMNPHIRRLPNYNPILVSGGRAGRLRAFGSAVPGDAVLGAAGQGARRHPAAPLPTSGGAAGRADRTWGTPPRVARRQTRPCPHKGKTSAMKTLPPNAHSSSAKLSAAVQLCIGIWAML